MKWLELEGRGRGCKEHPNDKQLPGVCSSCLRDKLSQLCNKNPIIDPLGYSPSPSSLASPQPLDSATDASSNHGSSAHRRRFRRNASHATGSAASCMLSMKKSRSLGFASRNRVRERDVNGGRGRKKDGFWSKVLKLKRKDTEESVANSWT